MDVEKIINKYIKPDSKLHENYYAHVNLVTRKATEIANRLGLDNSQKIFIYEAAMLHDIGVVKVSCSDIGSYGELPYIQHLIAGEEILLGEGLEKHALVARRHCTPTLSPEYIETKGINLPVGEYRPQTLEEKIVCFADQFSSKGCSKTLKGELQTLEDVIIGSAKYGEESERAIWDWAVEFGEVKI